MACEVIQNGLPPVALLLHRMSWLTIECYAYSDSIRALSEFDVRCAIAEGILDQFVLYKKMQEVLATGQPRPGSSVGQ